MVQSLDVKCISRKLCVAMLPFLKSMTMQEREMMGFLAMVQFGERMVIGYYSGTLIHAILFASKHLHKKHKEQNDLCESVEDPNTCCRYLE